MAKKTNISEIIESLNTNIAFLLEKVDPAKTEEQMGKKLEARMAQDNSVRGATVADVIQKAIDADPTPNDKYALWILRTYLKGGIKRIEDFGQVAKPLEIFDKFKQRMEIKDINQIKDIVALEKLTEPHNDAKSNKAIKKDARQEFITKGEAKVVLDNDKYSVIIPKTKAASCEFGRGTRWCTAAENDNMFDHYAGDGDLFIITDKKDVDEQGRQRKWQFHFETKQFMDEEDSDISLYQFFTDHKVLLKEVKPFAFFFAFTKEGYRLRIPIKN